MARMKSRWLRFSLHTLLLLITALCVWLGLQVNAARRQKEAVAAILNADGMVVYDYQVVPRGPMPAAMPGIGSIPAGALLPKTRVDQSQLPHGPAWLRQRFGDDYFRTVVAVYFNHPKATIQKTDLDELVKLPHVKEFVLEGTRFHDADLTALGELRELEEIGFLGVRVDGSILGRLTNPERLKRLCLSRTNIDDTALEQIGKMTSLEVLWLDGTHVSDAGLQHLRNLTNLKNFYLYNTQITDAGLQHLRGLQNLTYVYLRPSRVTDAGVSSLRSALPNANIVGP